ncbi:MAG: PKD domain-containing protein [Chitinophaga sp.]|uniref:PKD domain-containing protein n=1 Tax=Chitinophaga sp. TaxID=1869181 RepID=UPI001B072576|nr:PKD domain-containing protein [Chitinophaga sp.]MBO9731350.1 PKD domain-containing protein [Chitinophaga sp.]
MKASFPFNKLLFVLLGMAAITACKKDTSSPDKGFEAFFSYTVDGKIVSFKNLSTLATTYSWDFGDGSSTADKDPTHTYPAKGRYVITLYATAADGKKTEASTVLIIDKKSPVKLDDNSLADWDGVTNEFVNPAADVGKKIKWDYDGTNIYLYVEQQGSITDSTILGLFIDADHTGDPKKDSATGFYHVMYPAMGADLYLEGQPMLGGTGSWWGAYNFTGGAAHAGWSWAALNVPPFYIMGASASGGGVFKYELALKRSVLSGLFNKQIAIGLTIYDKGWSEVGHIPGNKKVGGIPIDLDVL